MSLSSKLIFNIHLLLGLAVVNFVIPAPDVRRSRRSFARRLQPNDTRGITFGAPFQFVAAFTGLAVPLLAITGPLIWLRKYRK